MSGINDVTPENNDYANRPGQSSEIRIVKDGVKVEDPIDGATTDSDAQLGENSAHKTNECLQSATIMKPSTTTSWILELVVQSLKVVTQSQVMRRVFQDQMMEPVPSPG